MIDCARVQLWRGRRSTAGCIGWRVANRAGFGFGRHSNSSYGINSRSRTAAAAAGTRTVSRIGFRVRRRSQQIRLRAIIAHDRSWARWLLRLLCVNRALGASRERRIRIGRIQKHVVAQRTRR